MMVCHTYVCKKRNRVKNILNFQIFQVEFKNIVILVRDIFSKNNHLSFIVFTSKFSYV